MTGKDRNSRLWGQSMQSDMDDETRRGRSPGTRALGCSREERQGRRRLAESQGMSSLWYWRGSGGGAYSAGGDSRLGEALCDRSISMTGTDRRGRSREPRHLDRGEEDGFPGRECGRRAQAGFAAQTTRRRRETADAADLQVRVCNREVEIRARRYSCVSEVVTFRASLLRGSRNSVQGLFRSALGPASLLPF